MRIMSPDELAAWMKRNGYTTATLAEALGTPRSTVWCWLKGHRRISKTSELALKGLENEVGRRGLSPRRPVGLKE